MIALCELCGTVAKELLMKVWPGILREGSISKVVVLSVRGIAEPMMMMMTMMSV